MLTRRAIAAAALDHGGDRVFTRAELAAVGYDYAHVQAQLAAGRWRLVGRSVVAHNGPLSRDESWWSAVLSSEPGTQLASFSALESHGLRGWEREEAHLLTSAGARRPAVEGVHVVVHRTTRSRPAGSSRRPCQPVADAAVLAASAFRSPRPACGVLAAAVQQRLVMPEKLADALRRSPRVRHRSALRAAVADIAGGSDALSEIDFVRLCRRFDLPPPVRQSMRREPNGKRRYLDAEWRRRDGSRLVAEIDGAIHLGVRRWVDDQLRQNEVVIGGSTVLRFPTVVVRHEQSRVADQLRRGLWL